MKKGNIKNLLLSSVKAALMICSICFLLGPFIGDMLFDHRIENEISAFQRLSGCMPDLDLINGQTKDVDDVIENQNLRNDDAQGAANYDAALYQKMQGYNHEIFTNGQSEISDLNSFEALPEALKSIKNQMIGYIEIPSIDVKLPLYAGATEENLEKGAAVLSNTSMPVGGENTNCVIAGHRGYYNSAYFRDIEDIAPGDNVYVTNMWETLAYKVSEIKIIDPVDVSSIKIQEGRELLTLLTCHPYRGGGKYRYLVFCERFAENETENMDETAGETEMPAIIVQDTQSTRRPYSHLKKYQKNIENISKEQTVISSKTDIWLEQIFRMMGVICIISAVFLKIIKKVLKKMKRE